MTRELQKVDAAVVNVVLEHDGKAQVGFQLDLGCST